MLIRAAIAGGGPQPFNIEPFHLALPQAHEVLVKLVATGMCHTDLAIAHQDLPLSLPWVLGHEGAGIVAKVGADVRSVAADDHVILTYGSCGGCGNCRCGHVSYCDSFTALNFTGYRADGSSALRDERGRAVKAHFFGQSSFATYAVVPERNVVQIRKDAPLRVVAPLACGFQTGAGTVLNVLRPDSDSTIAIFGAGAVGLAALLAAKTLGCRRIVAVDRIASRLELAAQLGATDVIDTARETASERLDGLGGVDFAVETTGVPSLIEAAAQNLRTRGTCALVGASRETRFTVDIMKLLGGRSIVGVREGDSDPHRFIPHLLELFMAGEFPLQSLVKSYPFDQINEAAEDSVQGRTIKPVLLFDPVEQGLRP